MARNADRPKNPTMRTWLVKFRGLDAPVEVEAEYRGAARHYAKSMTDDLPIMRTGDALRQVEWARLKRD